MQVKFYHIIERKLIGVTGKIVTVHILKKMAYTFYLFSYVYFLSATIN